MSSETRIMSMPLSSCAVMTSTAEVVSTMPRMSLGQSLALRLS